MLKAPHPEDEQERLREVRAVCQLSATREDRFDRVSRIACALFKVPVAMVAWMDRDTQFIKSVEGFDVSEAPRDISFCGHTIAGKAPLIVEDTLNDKRFSGNPWVVENPEVRFYAGCPIRGPINGSVVGTVCLYDMKPRAFGEVEVTLLRDLAILIEESLAVENHNSAVGRLRRRTNQLAEYLDYSPQLIYWAQPSGKIVYVNTTLMQRLGYPIGKAPTHVDQIVASASESDRRQTDYENSSDAPIQKLKTADGKIVLTKGESVAGEYDSKTVLRWTLRDIEAEVQHENRLRDEAETDPLTQVYNRRGFERRYGESIAALNKDQKLCFGVVDVDSLKQINDGQGHAAGDIAIRAVSDTMQQNMRATDTLARSGGDEFWVVLLNLDLAKAKEILARVQAQLQSRTENGPNPTVSVGVVEIRPDTEFESAYRVADRLLYQAKHSGRNAIVGDDASFSP